MADKTNVKPGEKPKRKRWVPKSLGKGPFSGDNFLNDRGMRDFLDLDPLNQQKEIEPLIETIIDKPSI